MEMAALNTSLVEIEAQLFFYDLQPFPSEDNTVGPGLVHRVRRVSPSWAGGVSLDLFMRWFSGTRIPVDTGLAWGWISHHRGRLSDPLSKTVTIST